MTKADREKKLFNKTFGSEFKVNAMNGSDGRYEAAVERGWMTRAEFDEDVDERLEADALRNRMADILSRTAIALRGPEPPLTRWSWHDLPELAELAVKSMNITAAELAERVARGEKWRVAGKRYVITVHADGCVWTKIVDEVALEEEYLLTQWGSLSDIVHEEKEEYLSILRDNGNWVPHEDGDPRGAFTHRLEDATIEIFRL